MIQHIIITEFSRRGVYLSEMKGRDPLRKKNLEHRFQLFELSCLPSMLNQVEKDFTWIFIVDPNLPKKYRERLANLLSGRINSFIHTLKKGTDLSSLSWLKPYIKQNVEFVLTTKLDDDDALFTGFTQYLKEHINELKRTTEIPMMKFFGCKDAVQWDFFWSKSAPFGYTKPWTRINSLPVSAGLSLLCKYPELDFSVLSIGHSLIEPLRNYGLKTTDLPSSHNRLRKYRNRIKNATIDTNIGWDGNLSPTENFHYLETYSMQVVMVNHINNVQYMRMFERHELRKPVNVIKSFPGMAIDFDFAARNIHKHKKSAYLLFKTIIRAMQFMPDNRKRGLYTSLRERYRRMKRAARGVMTMK